MKIYIILTSLLFVGCSTSSTGINLFDDSVVVEHLMYANAFIYPESQGKFFGANIKLAYSGTDSVKLIDDIDNVSLNSNPQLQHGGTFNLNYTLGIIPYIDIYYSQGLGVKLQIVGSTADASKSGNFSIALAAHELSQNYNVSTSDTTGSVKEAEAKVSVSGFRYSLLLGYRNNEKTLIYGGPFYMESNADNVNIYQTNLTDFSFRGDVASGKGKVQGVVLGIYNQTKKSVFDTLSTGLGLEAAYTQAEWTNDFVTPEVVDENEGFHIGGVVTLGW